MNLGENIKKYRQQNQLSQTQLAKDLAIARQSVSKWENGETLPSIDNLIQLSGLLNISLDELIMGEAYLHFPLDFGRPTQKGPILFVAVFSILLAAIMTTLADPWWLKLLIGTLTLLAGYLFTTSLFFDFSRYYDYWTLEKEGLRYPLLPQSQHGLINALAAAFLPLRGWLGQRKTGFISYTDIVKIQLVLVPFGHDPNDVLAYYPAGGRAGLAKWEDFYLLVQQKSGEPLQLNLRAYHDERNPERKYLSAILSFLGRKQLELVDPRGLAKIIRKRESVIATLYREGSVHNS